MKTIRTESLSAVRHTFLVFVLLWVFAGLAACSQPLTVEQQVITVIRDMEASIEAGKRRDFMEHVSEDFTGQGAIDNRDQLNAMILYQFGRHKKIQAQFLPIRVTPTMTGEAEAFFRVLLTGGDGLLPDSGQMYSMVTRWREDDGDWMLVSARWKTVAMEALLE